MIPKVGDAVGPFTLVKLLGQGGMGAVFVARHPSGADVALKVLLDPQPGILERFKREVSAMTRVDRHPSIVRVHTAGTFGPMALPYVVMELVPGTDLSKAIGGRPMEPLRAASIVERIARAVEHCHAQGVIHRDLKPANILVRAEDGEPVVTDFGLARDDRAEALTKTGEMLGTAAYMSPEQLEGDRTALDRRTDVYALGAILYECLTGEPPFKADSPTRLLKMVLIDDPADPRRRVPSVPPDLAVIALKCLSKERDRRYRTAGALADELARVRAGEPILARPESARERLRRKVRRRRREILIGGGGLVLLVAGGAASYLATRTNPAQVLESATAEAANAAAKADFPFLPAAPVATLTAPFAALRAAMARPRVFPTTGALVLDRWERLTREPRETLAAAPVPDELADALDAIAALRLGDAALLSRVESRSGERPRKMLEAHRGTDLGALAAAFQVLSKDAKRLWAATFVEDVARTVDADCASASPKAGSLLTLVQGGDPPELGARLRAALSPASWTSLGLRLGDAALELHAALGRPPEAAAPLAEGLCELARGEIVDDRGRLRPSTQRVKGFDHMRKVAGLGRPVSPELAVALMKIAGDRDSDNFTDRFECFAALVELGITPGVHAVLWSAQRLAPDKERDRDDAACRSAAAFAKLHEQEPLARVVAGVCIIEAAGDLEALDRNRPAEPGAHERPWSAYYEQGRKLLETPGLAGPAHAFRCFERGRLMLVGGLRRPGLAMTEWAYNEPEQLRIARKSLLEAEAYPRPWARLKLLVEIQLRSLKRLVADGKDAPAPQHAEILAAAEAELAELIGYAGRWGEEIARVLATAPKTLEDLGDTKSAADEQRALLANLYEMNLVESLGSDPWEARAAGHEQLVELALAARDDASARRHHEAAIEALTHALEAAPERAGLRATRGAHFVSLGRNLEARADLEEALRANPAHGGLRSDERRIVEETLKNLK